MSSKNRLEQEIPPTEIFEQMLSNSHKKFNLYNDSMINKEYMYHRKNIFNMLHKITNKLGFKSQVFYLATHYLDIIFSSKNNIKYKFNIYTIALACFCLSAKFCEIDPIVPELFYFIKVYYNIIGYKIKNPISLQELKYAEVFVLKILNYKLNYYTIYDFNSFLFIYGILKSQQRNKNYNSKQIMEKIYKKSRYYLDVILINTKLCFKFDTLFLSILIIEKSIQEILNKENKNNNLLFNEIIKNIFEINYEKNKQYHCLISDEETIKVFDKNNNDNTYNKININKKKVEKGEICDNMNIFNKSLITPSNENKPNFVFSGNKFRNTYKKLDTFNSISKDSTRNQTSTNFFFNKTEKEKDYIDTTSFTSRNDLNNNLELKYYNLKKEKNCEFNHTIIYSKYTYNGNEYKGENNNKNIEKKYKNSSVEYKNKNINLIKYSLTSQKKYNKNTLNSIRKSVENNNNRSIKTLYQKKLIHLNTNENNKMITSFIDDEKKKKVTYGIIKINSNNPKKETSIEFKNKNDLKTLEKNNFFKKINYNKLINNVKIEKTSSVNKNKNNSLNYFKIDKTPKNKLIFLNNINNLKKEKEKYQTITTRHKNLNSLKDSNIIKNMNDINMNDSKEKTFKTYNIHKYKKNKTKANEIQNPLKNKLSYLLGLKNTNLHNKLKEINIAIANTNSINKKLNKEIDLNATLPNRNTINFFNTQKNNFYKVKQDTQKEGIIKNQQDEKKVINNNNNKHEKISSSTIVINNNINLNIDNNNMNSDTMKCSNVYKKNKIMNMKSKKYFNISKNYNINGLNDTFYKTHLYTKTLENNCYQKIF